MGLSGLIDELTRIRDEVASFGGKLGELASEVHPDCRASALNLLHYLSLRQRDVRPLQPQLARLGLSSLGRAEPHVMATLDAVLTALHALNRSSPDRNFPAAMDWQLGPSRLEQHASLLLGPAPQDRLTRIMVTVPREAADDYTLVHDLVCHGMDCMRINCAHDDETIWLRMIENLQRARRSTGRACRISMDLAGPKLRTGPLEELPGVVKIRPVRNAEGRVVKPAGVLLATCGAPPCLPPGVAAWLPVGGLSATEMHPGTVMHLQDARGAHRTLTVVGKCESGYVAESRRTCYFIAGTRLLFHEADGLPRLATISALPPRTVPIVLRIGDVLVLSRDQGPDRAASAAGAELPASSATIGCTMPEVFEAVRVGDAIWFDDGKIGGRIAAAQPGRLEVRIEHALPNGSKLRSDRGINLPDSDLNVPALTAKDLADLEFVRQHADLVALSFASRAEDVCQLNAALAEREGRRPAVILKVETRRGFENLPAMLLAAMQQPSCGVMIARGDLAVECGFERLAEVQEEILWVCEAAHVPVIWATQVLESLAKEGLPSRAEITDAAMGHRAECVMLNKGLHIVRAVATLSDILRRMEAHQQKKRAMLRELRVASEILPPSP